MTSDGYGGVRWAEIKDLKSEGKIPYFTAKSFSLEYPQFKNNRWKMEFELLSG